MAAPGLASRRPAVFTRTVLPAARRCLPGVPARTHSRHLAVAAACVWLLTAAGVLLAVLLPGLAPSTRPRATLHGTLGELASVIANNLRVLAAPFLLAVFRWPSGRLTRRLGDLLISALIAQNTLSAGLALGRWGGRLLPYVPQLPLEWTALGIVGAAWMNARDGGRRHELAAYALATLALTITAAAVEVELTPHADTGQRADRHRLTQADPSLLAGSGCRLPSPDYAPPAARIASRSQAPFPSRRAFGSARPTGRRYRATSTTRSPQGGTKKCSTA
jgi:hypothetical protein